MITGLASLNPQRLSDESIQKSCEIYNWLAQFPEDSREIAKEILKRLVFITREVYEKWLYEELEKKGLQLSGVFSVRKLKNDILWDKDGEIALRPGESQGSEDYIYSLISIAKRKQSNLCDHPSLNEMRARKIHNIILIDDSIGSGSRVEEYIKAMMRHRSFLSWWSYGLIKIKILSFARAFEGEQKILSCMPGSGKSKLKKRFEKLLFSSKVVYKGNSLNLRWGERCEEIKKFCEDQAVNMKDEMVCLGFGKVMNNIIFHHSVPDNISGIIWTDVGRWRGLLTDRALPQWLVVLLNSQSVEKKEKSNDKVLLGKNMSEIVCLLELVQAGIRNPSSIAMRLDCERDYALFLLEKAKEFLFLAEGNHLTRCGYDLIKKSKHKVEGGELKHDGKIDRTLYVPKSWCVD